MTRATLGSYIILFHCATWNEIVTPFLRSFITSAITTNVQYLDYVDFYAHNDMDMMEIGNGGLTLQEERTHFAAWAFLKSPILLGTNVSTSQSQHYETF